MRYFRGMRWTCRFVWLLGGAALTAVSLLPAALAAEKGAVVVDQVEYKGWKNNLCLRNANAELIVTLEVGPRIISYKPIGKANVFAEFADQLGKSGEKHWMIRGGHRLWAGPEDFTRTYALDNGPVTHRSLGRGTVRLTQAPDAAYGIQKEIDLTLAPEGTRVAVIHRITNVGDKPTELAAWALTAMAPGGVEYIPLPPKRPHPSGLNKSPSPEDFAPDQSLILWPYFDFTDPRWSFGQRYIRLRQDPKATRPTKIGIAHRGNWVAYLNNGTLFVKRFAYLDGKVYPDRGANFETFTNADMLEVETMGPLTKLAAGEKVELTEEWQLFVDMPQVVDEADIDKQVRPLAEKK